MATISFPKKISFIDLVDREERARKQITVDLEALQNRRGDDEKRKRRLSDEDEKELQRLLKLSELVDLEAAADLYFDPLFAAAKSIFADDDSELRPVLIHHDKAGVISASLIDSAEDDADASADANADGTAKANGNSKRKKRAGGTDAQIGRAALVLGLLQSTGAPVPPIRACLDKEGKVTGEIEIDKKHANFPKFAEAFYRAIGRTAGNLDLAMRTLRTIADAVDIVGDGEAPKISTLEFAQVVEKLIRRGVASTDANLKRLIDETLDRVVDTDEERPEHEIGIRMPDLELTTDNHVVEDNVRLIGPMIFASMFDELKAFQVVDKLVEMSQRGELALAKGKAGTRLYSYWRQAPTRMSEIERQTFYAITLGLPSGPPGVTVNRDFQDLWIRFVSSVTTLVRESRVDQLIRSALPHAVNQQQIKKAARDLTTNMSLYGYGMAYYAAIDLQKQINEMIELLQDEELRRAFGARDMWGVIDQVAATELGGARNGSKYRMLAMSGNIITTWLANNLARIRDATRPMINIRDVENEPSRGRGQTASTHPTDYDLVNACEMWLADSAMDDERVEQLSQPRESPQQPSRPIQIPSFARDLLAGAGLSTELSAGNRNGRPNGRPNGRGNGPYVGY